MGAIHIVGTVQLFPFPLPPHLLYVLLHVILLLLVLPPPLLLPMKMKAVVVSHRDMIAAMAAEEDGEN